MSTTRLERIKRLKKKEFLEIIEAKRIELIEIAAKYGLSSKTTIEYSQKLDQLLNQYNQISN